MRTEAKLKGLVACGGFRVILRGVFGRSPPQTFTRERPKQPIISVIVTKDNVVLIAALIVILALMVTPERSAQQSAPGVTDGVTDGVTSGATNTQQRSVPDVAPSAAGQTEPRLDTITVEGATWELIDEVRVCTPDEAYRIAYGVLEPLPPDTVVTLETGERCRYRAR